MMMIRTPGGFTEKSMGDDEDGNIDWFLGVRWIRMIQLQKRAGRNFPSGWGKDELIV